MLLLVPLFMTCVISPAMALPPPPPGVRAIPGIIGGGYTPEEREHIQAGFEEVFELIKVYKSAGPDIVNPIFEKYFVPEDKSAVDSLFTKIHSRGEGSHLLNKISIVDDTPLSGQLACSRKGRAAELRGHNMIKAEVIICPIAFKFPRLGTDRCGKLGDGISYRMISLGMVLLHEYTHWNRLVTGALPRYTEDLAYGPKFLKKEDGSKLERSLAKGNADSFAWLLTEVYWSQKCKRKFAGPELPVTVDEDDQQISSFVELLKGWLFHTHLEAGFLQQRV